MVGKPSILFADELIGNLDSNNSEVVMQLLDELYKDGATICMVTHDLCYACYVIRSIHLFDGRVVEEEESAARTRDERALQESGYEIS